MVDCFFFISPSGGRKEKRNEMKKGKINNARKKPRRSLQLPIPAETRRLLFKAGTRFGEQRKELPAQLK